MHEEYKNKNQNNFDNEIDYQELFKTLLEGKLIIASVTAFVSTIAVIYSLLLPNIYESKALLVPVEPSSSLSGALGDLGGFAGFAGINIPSEVTQDNSAQAIKKLNSLSFFENSLFNNIHLPDLMAVKSWDYKTNTVIYDDDIYDIDTNTWVRDYSYPQKKIPSIQESFKIFTEEHLSISEDRKSGFITLSIRHQSPYLAKEWIELAVNEVNNFYRQKDKLKSEKSVNYLNQQILETSLSEVKEVLAKLLQEETKKLTLVEANTFYVFDYLDPPAVMEEKSDPKRALICILGALFGGALGIFLALMRRYFFRKNS